jgi:hypothetical protein
MVRKEEKAKDQHERGPEYVKDKKKGYEWYEMSIFTRWDYPNKCQVLCVDTPDDLPAKLMKALEKRPALNFQDPFAMHLDLVNQIICIAIYQYGGLEIQFEWLRRLVSNHFCVKSCHES